MCGVYVSEAYVSNLPPSSVKKFDCAFVCLNERVTILYGKRAKNKRCSVHGIRYTGIAFVHILYGMLPVFYAEFLLMCFFLFMFQFHNQMKKAKKKYTSHHITSQRMDHTVLIIIGTNSVYIVVVVVVIICI